MIRGSIHRRTALLALAALLGMPLAAPAAAPPENRWEELVPPGWDPMAGIKQPTTLGMLSDSDPRVLEMMRELREIWDNAPTRPELDGKPFRISGYVVPLDQMKGEVREFLLVPYFGACIHTPPPPSNQIVHVFASRGGKGLRTMDVVTVQGTLQAKRGDTVMGASGYRILEATVEPYVPAPAK